MYINTDQMVSMTEANRNFSKVAKMVEDKKEIIIMKNNKPRYVMMDYDEYEVQSNAGLRVSDGQVNYGSSALSTQLVKVSEDGLVKLPDNIQESLNIGNDKEIVFIKENGKIVLMSSLVYAFKKLQKSLAGKAAEAGLGSPQELDRFLEEIRQEVWDEWYENND